MIDVSQILEATEVSGALVASHAVAKCLSHRRSYDLRQLGLSNHEAIVAEQIMAAFREQFGQAPEAWTYCELRGQIAFLEHYVADRIRAENSLTAAQSRRALEKIRRTAVDLC